MSTPGIMLGVLMFWLAIYFAVHFHNSTVDHIKDMGKPERFAMELLSSSAAAIVIMVVICVIDVMAKS